VVETLKSDGLPAAAFRPYDELAARTESALRRASRLLKGGPNGWDSRVTDVVSAALIETFETDTGCEVAHDDVRLLRSSPESEQAVYLLSREFASSAEILVTTHATTAINLALRAFEGDGEFGGGFEFLVIDEADQWAKAAGSVSMVQLSLESVQGELRRMTEVGRESPIAKRVNGLALGILASLDELQRCAPQKGDVSAAIERGDPVFDILSELERELQEVTTASTDNGRFASASGAVSESAQDIGRLLRLVRSNGDFWEPRWVTSRVLAKPSLVWPDFETGLEGEHRRPSCPNHAFNFSNIGDTRLWRSSWMAEHCCCHGYFRFQLGFDPRGFMRCHSSGGFRHIAGAVCQSLCSGSVSGR
jgi:hypothetical protein